MFDAVNERRFRGGELRLITGTANLPQARNNMMKAFLKSEAEWLVSIDTDMGFTDDTVERLLASADPVERPVVGGLCFVLRGTPGAHTELHASRYTVVPTLYDWVEVEEEVGFTPIVDYPRDALVECAGTGTAMILIHRSAAEAVQEKCGDEWFTMITHPTGDNGEPRTFGEDLSFCVRLASVGVPVYVNTAVKTTHDKGALFLDEETFDLSRNAASVVSA